MSVWEKIEDKDIDIELEDKYVAFYVGFDKNGNHYLTLTFEQIEEIYNKTKEKEDGS